MVPIVEIDKWRSYGYIRVVGTSVPPDEVSQVLGRVADESWVMGEPRRQADGHYTFHCWVMHLGGSTEDENYADRFSESVSELGSDLAARFACLVDRDMGVVLEYVQRVAGENDHLAVGLSLLPEAIQWLATAKASLDIDQYLYDTP